ncbi:MAG: DUF2937 family protein [Paracoccus sp. (in: a-proteobacteria)]|uniref:DUF2937 family protein n=1 Tax=Paracoccus sp. TaxID=267 RepID=UPI0026DFD693|nr:DUF2937 family protein [Paracoccus sp. (in: a-proteobacteria)]MDO5613497.1 DUF2937 family protein [Paracoccus sp. (in: a-proteobacteria)]
MAGVLRLGFAACCAAALSQFPAFSDQYVQRLGGQVDALSRVTADFDSSASRAGLTREQALADLSGSTFRDLHQRDMGRVFTRLDRARADLALLRAAAPLERIALPHRLRDPATLAATWGDFRPALPVTTAGITAAAIGLGLGMALWSAVAALLRRRRRADIRHQPPALRR